MPYSNSIISAPVAMSDVQNALGSSSTDLGTLCKHANINKWAKYKPVRLPSVDTVTGQWSASLNAWLSSATWWKGDGLCGMSTDWATEFGNSLTTSGTFMYKLTHGQLGWNYLKPGGGATQPYRLQDFAQYFHNAVQPYGDIGSTTIYLDNTGKGQIDWEVVSVDSLNLKLSDISVNGHPLTDFYLGLILWKNNQWFLFTSSTKFSTGASLSVEITNMSSYAGTWNCMPFFTLYRTNSGGTFDSNGLFISLADTTPLSIELLTHGNNYFDYIDGTWNSAGTAISYELQIENETSVAHTYTSIRISIYRGSSDSPVAWTDITNVTVSANSSRTLTGTISVSKISGYVYRISATDNTSGSTIPSVDNQVEEYGGM